MKALLLTFGLSLLAALQAQAFPTTEENQDVRLRGAGAVSGFKADRGRGCWLEAPFLLHLERHHFRVRLEP